MCKLFHLSAKTATLDLAEHNRRYARVAAAEADYHRRQPTARQLNEVFWLEEERVVSEDWVVRYKNRLPGEQRQAFVQQISEKVS